MYCWSSSILWIPPHTWIKIFWDYIIIFFFEISIFWSKVMAILVGVKRGTSSNPTTNISRWWQLLKLILMKKFFYIGGHNILWPFWYHQLFWGALICECRQTTSPVFCNHIRILNMIQFVDTRKQYLPQQLLNCYSRSILAGSSRSSSFRRWGKGVNFLFIIRSLIFSIFLFSLCGQSFIGLLSPPVKSINNLTPFAISLLKTSNIYGPNPKYLTFHSFLQSLRSSEQWYGFHYERVYMMEICPISVRYPYYVHAMEIPYLLSNG